MVMSQNHDGFLPRYKLLGPLFLDPKIQAPRAMMFGTLVQVTSSKTFEVAGCRGFFPGTWLLRGTSEPELWGQQKKKTLKTAPRYSCFYISGVNGFGCPDNKSPTIWGPYL